MPGDWSRTVLLNLIEVGALVRAANAMNFRFGFGTTFLFFLLCRRSTSMEAILAARAASLNPCASKPSQSQHIDALFSLPSAFFRGGILSPLTARLTPFLCKC